MLPLQMPQAVLEGTKSDVSLMEGIQNSLRPINRHSVSMMVSAAL